MNADDGFEELLDTLNTDCGDALRVVATHSENSSTLLYARPDVKDAHRTFPNRTQEAVSEWLEPRTPDDDGIQATVEVYEGTTILHLPISGEHVVSVVLDSIASLRLNAFVRKCHESVVRES